MLRSAAERQFEILGEAMTRLVKVDRALAEQIREYRRVIAFRNVLIHGYDAVDDRITWSVVVTKVPALTEDLERILKELDPIR